MVCSGMSGTLCSEISGMVLSEIVKLYLFDFSVIHNNDWSWCKKFLIITSIESMYWHNGFRFDGFNHLFQCCDVGMSAGMNALPSIAPQLLHHTKGT